MELSSSSVEREIFAAPMRDHDDNIHDACDCRYEDSKIYAAYSYFIKVENFGESLVIRQNILPPKFCIVRYRPWHTPANLVNAPTET